MRWRCSVSHPQHFPHRPRFDARPWSAIATESVAVLERRRDKIRLLPLDCWCSAGVEDSEDADAGADDG